jgi:flagellar motor component MotA
MPKQYLDAKEKAQQTAQKKLAELSFEEIDELFTTMAEIARREGILALEESGGKAADPFLQRAILLAVDGTQPELIKDMLDKWQASLLREQEVKYRKVIEGLRGIQAGDNPRIVEHKLAMIF